MKIIDLLNKIANGEEVPKKIKYKNKIYEWEKYDVCYGKTMTKKGWVKELGYVAEENRTYFYLKHCYQNLNDEVEILDDEEDKNIPFIPDNELYKIDNDEKLYEEKYAIDYNFKVLKEKINQVIEVINNEYNK